MTAVPNHQQAIIQGDAGGLLLVSDRAVPEPGPHQVLVKTAAWALNPCDWKMPTNFPCPGTGNGSDYSGSIVRLGSSVQDSDLKVGDRVAGAVHASNSLDPQAGAFAEYIVVCADQLWRVPYHMTWTDAAAIGWCVVGTVGLAAFRALKLPGTPENPAEKPAFVLVYGGSTASGIIAIQILKLSGFRVVTTCSAANFELVASYGAEMAFDYHSPTCAEDIKRYTKNNLKYVMDIIADTHSIRVSYAAIGRAGGSYVGFELVPEEVTSSLRKVVTSSWVLGIRMSGSKVALDGGYGAEADPELRAWGCTLFQRMETLLHEGKLRPHRVEVGTGGLHGVMDGIETMREKRVSGKKLVYVAS